FSDVGTKTQTAAGDEGVIAKCRGDFGKPAIHRCFARRPFGKPSGKEIRFAFHLDRHPSSVYGEANNGGKGLNCKIGFRTSAFRGRCVFVPRIKRENNKSV